MEEEERVSPAVFLLKSKEERQVLLQKAFLVPAVSTGALIIVLRLVIWLTRWDKNKTVISNKTGKQAIHSITKKTFLECVVINNCVNLDKQML